MESAFLPLAPRVSRAHLRSHARSSGVSGTADASRNERGRPLRDFGRNAGHSAHGAGGSRGRRRSGAAHEVARPDRHSLRTGRQRRRRLRRRAAAWRCAAMRSNSDCSAGREALKGDPALAAARYQGPVLDAAAVDLAERRLRDRRFVRRRARPRHRWRSESDHRADQRLSAAPGGRVLAVDVPSGNRRGNRQGSRRRGRSERERDLLSPEARPSVAAGTHALRRDPARRHRHSRGRA